MTPLYIWGGGGAKCSCLSFDGLLVLYALYSALDAMFAFALARKAPRHAGIGVYCCGGTDNIQSQFSLGQLKCLLVAFLPSRLSGLSTQLLYMLHVMLRRVNTN